MIASSEERARRFLALYGAAALLAFLLACAFAYRPTGWLQALSALVFVASVPLVVWALIRTFQYRWRGAAAGLLLVLAYPLAVLAGNRLREADFEYRLQERYEGLVSSVEVGEVSVGLEPRQIPVPPSLKGLTYSVTAWHNERGTLTLVYFWGGGFPVKHSAFVYRSDGIWRKEEPGLTWWRCKRLARTWFDCAD